jgi:hypothetical protein
MDSSVPASSITAGTLSGLISIKRVNLQLFEVKAEKFAR